MKKIRPSYNLPQGGLDWRMSANLAGVIKKTEVDPMEISAFKDIFTR